MEDKCINCGADVSDQSKWYCRNCEVSANNINTTALPIYITRLNKYIKWINDKPSKWKFISYIKWLNKRPPKPW